MRLKTDNVLITIHPSSVSIFDINMPMYSGNLLQNVSIK